MVGVQKRKEEEHTMSQVEQTSIQTRIRQLAALAGFITAVLACLSFEQVQTLLKNKKELRKKLQQVFDIPIDPFADLRRWWEEFYLKYFGLTVDFSEVFIPKKPTDGLYQAIFVAEGLALNATIVAMRKLFKVWVYNEDLDANVTTNTRTSVKSYVVWVRVGDEPDAEYLGKSTRDADMGGEIGVTLLERLLLGLKHFTETGKHLDIKGVTFCTGSRGADGDVPDVYWSADDGWVDVRWCRVDDALAGCGLRQAVS